MTGLSLLEKDSWEKHYSLTLKMYDAASEALFVTGDFERLSSLIETPLRHARCFEDKLNIYNNHVRSLVACKFGVHLQLGLGTIMYVPKIRRGHCSTYHFRFLKSLQHA